MTKLTKYLLVVFSLLVIALIAIVLALQNKNSQALTINFTPTAREKEEQKENEEITFTFAGDAMFGRAVQAQFKGDYENAFRNLPTNFFNTDVAVLNLEGPISPTDFSPNTDPENLVFKFPPSTTEALKNLGINAASLANNHTSNQGQTMLENTREVLTNAQITPIGDPQNKTDIAKTFAKGDSKISILAVNILANTPDLAETIKEQKNDNAFVIVFPHWGNEYQTTHSKTQEKLAHDWIDQGADLVIGSHPHVVQDAETYNNKPIFYSLGNFLFDQTFSYETQRGLVLKGKIKNQKLSLELIPIGSLHLRPYLLEGEEKDEIINNLKKSLGFEENNNPIELNIN